MNIVKYFEAVTGHVFKNVDLITEAVTHSSYANENKMHSMPCNERLEFLGDSVLSIIISEYLFTHKPIIDEGDMTRIRAALVCETTLAGAARSIDLGSVLLLGHGEARTGGRNRSSVLADAMEAVLAALYLDSGYDAARSWILNLLDKDLKKALAGRLHHDYKTSLQELIQSKSNEKLVYELVREEGPDHDKVFEVVIKFSDKIIGSGIGKSKKEAEQQAAKNAMEVVQ